MNNILGTPTTKPYTYRKQNVMSAHISPPFSTILRITRFKCESLLRRVSSNPQLMGRVYHRKNLLLPYCYVTLLSPLTGYQVSAGQKKHEEEISKQVEVLKSRLFHCRLLIKIYHCVINLHSSYSYMAFVNRIEFPFL